MRLRSCEIEAVRGAGTRLSPRPPDFSSGSQPPARIILWSDEGAGAGHLPRKSAGHTFMSNIGPRCRYRRPRRQSRSSEHVVEPANDAQVRIAAATT